MKSGSNPLKLVPSNDDIAFDLGAFERRSALEAFFRAVPQQWHDFDVLEVPGPLWSNLYLADVTDWGGIQIRLAGDSIRSWFNRDLRGLDLRATPHGAHSAEIIQAYDEAASTGRRFAIRQRLYLPTAGFVVRLECGVAPMIRDGTVRKMLGYLFLGRYYSFDPAEDQFILVR